MWFLWINQVIFFSWNEPQSSQTQKCPGCWWIWSLLCPWCGCWAGGWSSWNTENKVPLPWSLWSPPPAGTTDQSFRDLRFPNEEKKKKRIFPKSLRQTCSTVRGVEISSPRRIMERWVRTSASWSEFNPRSSAVQLRAARTQFMSPAASQTPLNTLLYVVYIIVLFYGRLKEHFTTTVCHFWLAVLSREQNSKNKNKRKEVRTNLSWRRFAPPLPSWTPCSPCGGSRPGGAGCHWCSPLWTASCAWRSGNHEKRQFSLFFFHLGETAKADVVISHLEQVLIFRELSEVWMESKPLGEGEELLLKRTKRDNKSERKESSS